MTIDATTPITDGPEISGPDPSQESIAPVNDTTTLGSVNRRRNDPLHNVELEVEVVLGRKKMLFRDVRELRVGAPIELERGRNEPVDVLVNGSPFAKGEIVVIGDQNLGVRITEILPADVEGF